MFARLSQLFRSKRTPASNDAGAIGTPDSLIIPDGTTMSWVKPVVIDSTNTPFMGVQLRCKLPF
ncbi:hypothetical protein [Burkholderia vietnamiensis]|uniref:hypothetical protein n=1 Tax=Burkholderia vietnamiensis TaxID=60552 RepID=UPI001CF52102|nr:hypothetical protein [Burkholderia vietnamiensis]MCA8448963.1 hypothetical protein [Burkholderia vietnamiensis]